MTTSLSYAAATVALVCAGATAAQTPPGATLAQASAQRLFRRSWTVDANGRLVVRQRIESVAFSTKEIQAVFDRAVQ